jgi:hypothetical protein
MLTGAILACAGCGGGGDDTTAPTERAGLPPSPLQRPEEAGRSGSERRRACELVRWPAVRRAVVGAGAAAPRSATARDTHSLDLSVCDWSAGGVGNVRLIVDSAPKAQLRYYNQLAEQLEYHNRDASTGQRPVQIRGVGEDSAYGGAGAWWTPTRKQLVGYARQRIVRVRVVVRGLGDAGRRRVATRLARLAFARLKGD